MSREPGVAGVIGAGDVLGRAVPGDTVIAGAGAGRAGAGWRGWGDAE